MTPQQAAVFAAPQCSQSQIIIISSSNNKFSNQQHTRQVTLLPLVQRLSQNH